MLSGIILLNKPRGVSSNTAVNIVKRAVNAEKAGHLGTLDVLGEGLLPIVLGKCTSLFDLYLQKDKIYETVFKFGETTDTLDMEGEITEKHDVTISLQDVVCVMNEFIGPMDQMPPIYSAKKIHGAKAYDLARKGQSVTLNTKRIEIYNIDVLQEIDKNTFSFRVHCSSGTYIRSLCRDIAAKLSTCGVMLSIIRTKCGDFNLEDAHTLEEIKLGNYDIIQPESLFHYPKYTVNERESMMLQNGVHIRMKVDDGKYNIYDENQYLGVVEVTDQRGKFVYRFI